MSTDISSIAFAIRAESAQSANPIKLSHAQQCAASVFGYKTLAAYQASPDENPGLDEARHIVLNLDMLLERGRGLGLPHDEQALISLVRTAFCEKLPRAQLYSSVDQFEEALRELIQDIVLNHGDVSGAMAVTNNDGIREIYLPFDIALDGIPLHGDILEIPIEGHVTMEVDVERPYAGHHIDVQARLRLGRLGRVIMGTASCEVESAKLDYNWGNDDPDDEPPRVSFTEALAELLGLSFDEADELIDTEVYEIEGHDDMAYGYVFDFTSTASKALAKKIQKKHGSLSVRVPLHFFERIHGRDTHPQRHYVHGDQDEGNKNQFFCARCDLFVSAEHFDQEHSGQTEERYFESLQRWKKRPAITKINLYRPIHAANILAEAAEVQRLTRENSRSDFHRWIEAQLNRNDPVGDLARDIKRDRKFPSSEASRDELRAHLERFGASRQAIKAFDSGWREFAATENRWIFKES